MEKMTITCNVGWVCRNLIYTTIVDELAERYEVTILCNSVTFDSVKKQLADKRYIKVKKLDLNSSFLTSKLKGILSATVVMKVAPNLATWMYPKSNSSRVIRFLFNFFNPLLRNVYTHLCGRDSIRDQVSQAIESPDKLIITSPFGWEDHYVQKNTQNGCRVYHLFLSWDNVYSKGHSFGADRYLVWADFMKEAVVKLHNCSLNDVYSIEVPHLGGGPSINKGRPKRNLLYSCINGRNYPQEIELVKLIKGWFIGGLNSYYDSLIIRTHPSGPNGVYDSLEDKDNGVVISHPTKANEESLRYWTPDNTELEVLSDIMSSSRTNINVASTMSIDSASHNCSVINVAFHSDPLIDQQVKSFYDFEHYRNLVDLGLVNLVFNEDELKSAIIEASKDVDSKSTLSIFNRVFDNRNGSFEKLFIALED
jgi:hypothetical protein